jgi:hypothetical protein
MEKEFKDILPPGQQSATLTVDQAQLGPHIPPQQQIQLYSSDEWEAFTHEWAHFCLKPVYSKVERFTGAGDKGIDIAGFTDGQKLQGVWDNYQCKHYSGALTPTDVWTEFGKVLWYSFNKNYAAPRKYFFVAPRGAGTKLAALLANFTKLRAEVIAIWDEKIRKEITNTQEVALEGAFLAYVKAFDFSIFDTKTALQIIEQHRTCPYHAARFGGGLPARKASETPPEEMAPTESQYVSNLLEAYGDHSQATPFTAADFKRWPKLKTHFGRQREAFYEAEGLRMFARDSVPEGTFESFQEEIYDGVIDTHEADHLNGFKRVCAVTEAARTLQLTSNALLTRAKPKDRDGICHQLSNDGWFKKWTK